MYNRLQRFLNISQNSIFLWGARQTGKSTLINKVFTNAMHFDLLETDVYRMFLSEPQRLREIVKSSSSKLVVIDEIQKLPTLLNEIHWLIEKEQVQFVLTGSSPRKMIQQQQNLLGGRAIRYELYPLVSAEIPDFDLLRALNHGLLPRHYLSEKPELLISNYIKSYLEDEIYAEARVRNLGLFADFLQKAAFSNGEMVNYSNIASDCGVSSPTVKEYFQILVETMIGTYVQPFQKKPNRKVVSTPKFYFFDVGVTKHLLKIKDINEGSESYGNAFEHFIYLELKVYANYAQKNFDIHFWRTASKLEVDFILGDHEVAIEVKSTNNVRSGHTKNLRAFMEEYTVKKSIVVCHERFPRITDQNIHILPWKHFLKQLWGGEVI